VRRYLETLTAWIAPSWARASRASMGVNITPPRRPRLTIIPAVAGRMLATPCAWGRISVTVDLDITNKDKAMRVPASKALANQWVSEREQRRAPRHVTRNVRK